MGKGVVIFSHGKESGPDGNKIKELSVIANKHGYRVIALDYRKCKDEVERIELLTNAILSINEPDICLVGSSMGGYISTVAAEQFQLSGLFLMNPAFYLDGYKKQTLSPLTSNIEMVVGWHDDVVPAENALKFGKEHFCVIHLLADNHRLKDSMEEVKTYFDHFLQKLTNLNNN